MNSIDIDQQSVARLSAIAQRPTPMMGLWDAPPAIKEMARHIEMLCCRLDLPELAVMELCRVADRYPADEYPSWLPLLCLKGVGLVAIDSRTGTQNKTPAVGLGVS